MISKTLQTGEWAFGEVGAGIARPTPTLTAISRLCHFLTKRRFGGVVVAMFTLVCLGAVAQSVSGDFDSVVASAAAARDQGDVGKAIELYTQAVTLNPKWPDGWWFLGTMQYGSDQYAPAREALTHFIALTPNAGPAMALRGLCEFELGLYPESLQDLEAGIALGAASQPRNAQILVYHQAMLLTRLGKFEQATGTYTTFAKQGAINQDIAIGVGLSGLRMPVFPKDVAAEQSELVERTGRAAIRVMTGDVAGGQQAFEELFERYLKTPNLHYFYGYLLFTTDPEGAVAQFRQELTVAPTSAIAHSMLAWTAEVQGNFAEALPDAQKAVAEDPSLPMAQLVAGRALVETGNVMGGMAHLETMLRMEPENIEPHLTLAKAYSKLGRKDEARRERLLAMGIADQGAGGSATP